jgi:pimeloyl-ACP methyl ester carboxylesterase
LTLAARGMGLAHLDFAALFNALPRLARPFLVVFGRQDRLIPYQQAER